METPNNENNYENLFLQNIYSIDEKEQGSIQTLFEEYPCDINERLVNLLQHGYQITREDRKTIRDKCGYDTYKTYATLSRLSFTLYQQGRSDLIPKMFSFSNSLIGAIFTIEALISNKPEYFDYHTNVWVCIANNAITHYKDYWIFCEAAFRKYGKWDEVYQAGSFRKKYDDLDKDAILQWKEKKEYEILKLLYPQLEIPSVQFQEIEKPEDLYLLANTLIKKSELSDILLTLSINIEKQRPTWGYHDITGNTAEDKIYTLWNTLPHETFFEALFYLSDSKHSALILELLIKYAENEVKDIIYNQDISYKLRIGLESGRIRNQDFLLLLWDIGYKHHPLQEWDKKGNRTTAEQMKLYCLDKLYNRESATALKEIIDKTVIQAICLIEDIKNNQMCFTGTPTWKSRINNLRSAKNNPLNDYWGYIDMALDGYHLANGLSMKNYLSQKEPGIKFEKRGESIDVNSNLYKALTILYPEIYK